MGAAASMAASPRDPSARLPSAAHSMARTTWARCWAALARLASEASSVEALPPGQTAASASAASLASGPVQLTRIFGTAAATGAAAAAAGADPGAAEGSGASTAAASAKTFARRLQKSLTTGSTASTPASRYLGRPSPIALTPARSKAFEIGSALCSMACFKALALLLHLEVATVSCAKRSSFSARLCESSSRFMFRTSFRPAEQSPSGLQSAMTTATARLGSFFTASTALRSMRLCTRGTSMPSSRTTFVRSSQTSFAAPSASSWPKKTWTSGFFAARGATGTAATAPLETFAGVRPSCMTSAMAFFKAAQRPLSFHFAKSAAMS
mmetsp:Transcript_59926/g.185851  ORF Transcript_59926/g.185851 Transcript_59926/m.185851 type:complete len:326 (+) Transcript_59926:572-1549(+)